ncbi:uncharacterized protein LOC116266434 [Nymphaea colorata]|nr:uncharacterized protein LOC116266434 [Nymphaea colorata]
MKVKVETSMTHDTMKVDLENPMSGFQKVKEELEADVVEEANQRGRTGRSLRAKQGIKVKKEKKDGNDTLWVNRALISNKAHGTGISGTVSFEHKCHLRRLLRKMMREQKWKGAAGVLSTLLKGTCKDYLSLKNRRKYWASLELLRRIGFSSGNLWKLERIYEIWSSKQRPGNRTSRKKKYLIQLEHALLLLMEAKVEDAYNITKFLVQEGECRNDSIIHLVHGLILYQMWYAGIPEGLQLRTGGRHEAAAFSSSDVLSIHRSRSRPVEAPDSDNAIDNLKECASGYNSESSIGNCKNTCFGINDKSSNRKPARRSHPCKLYMDPTAEIRVEESICTDDSYEADFSVSYAYLGSDFLPIRIQNLQQEAVDLIDSCRMMVNEFFKDAVKHLQLALSSKPPVFAALPLLVQLLLLGGQVEDALELLKNFSLNSEHSLPSRLRAYLLVHLRSKNLRQLSACHEDALRKDPTSSDSLIHLIKMHESGNYVMEKLIEMIAIHLDATCGTSYVWQHLAVLLLQVQTKQFQYEDDRFSTEHAYKGNTSLPSFTNTVLLPKMFSGREQQKVWKLRCRWWYTRHFSSKINLNENGTGDLQLLTCKAACAAHFYGRSFEYVADVYNVLKKQDGGSHIAVLKKHIDSCLDLQNKLNRK